eukprot:gnl/Trimastix_PCT/2416.p1 GENE.gnl/Trimastix_PCT/2416~~gnl/Trimastix_PCT/2416.p1  ORF type:complete len:256 (-),score=23.27 gnl/Trimastix_PCT/2416:799-1566(-)
MGLGSVTFSLRETLRRPFVLIVLNYTLPSFWRQIWAFASTVICADGALNMIYETGGSSFIPDVVVGDLDSLSESVRIAYASLTEFVVVDDPNQNVNDFGKCLLHVRRTPSLGALPVVVLGALGGRFDHSAANLSAASCFAAEHEQLIVLLSDASLVLPLAARGEREATHRILRDELVESRVCGLVPLTPCACVTTSGLRWDLTDQAMAMGVGGFVSTSNEAAAPVVTIRLKEGTLLWTTALRDSPQFPSAPRTPR